MTEAPESAQRDGGVRLRAVAPDEDGMRLDRWFRAHYPSLTHGALEKLLRKGQIRLDGGRARSNARLAAGQMVRVPPFPRGDDDRRRSVATPSARDPEDAKTIRSMTVFEDDQIIALNKPFGLAVQGGAKTTRHVDGMLAALSTGGADKPRLVHRLDRDTGGLLLLGKTRQAAAGLAAGFRGRAIEKTYWALTAGAPRPREGAIRLPVAKRMVRRGGGEVALVAPADGEDAKEALTDFQTMDEAGPVAFLALKPLTGRTHQLRVHCAAIGCPIVGDRKYGGEAAMVDGVAPRLHLFCRSMQFNHPGTGAPVKLTAPLTGHMLETWRFFSFDAAVEATWPDFSSARKDGAPAR